MKCINCGYFGNCENAEKVCEKFIKANRNITKLKSNDDGVFVFEKIYEQEKVNEK